MHLFTFDLENDLWNIAHYDIGIEEDDPFLTAYATESIVDAVRYKLNNPKCCMHAWQWNEDGWDYDEGLLCLADNAVRRIREGRFCYSLFTPQQKKQK